MWKTFIDISKQLFTVVQETQKNKADIKEVREQLSDLTKAVERLAYEIHRVSEREQYERQLLKLQQENEMLRFQQRLLSGRPGDVRDADA